MNEEFEKHLRRQPLAQIPSEWRKKILQEAKSSRHSSFGIRHSFFSALNSRLSTLFWPHPKAWAGLAALWVVIAAAHLASNDSSVQIAQKLETPSPEAVVILQQQQRLFAELVGPVARKDINLPKRDTAQPRSDRQREILCA